MKKSNNNNVREIGNTTIQISKAVVRNGMHHGMHEVCFINYVDGNNVRTWKYYRTEQGIKAATTRFFAQA